MKSKKDAGFRVLRDFSQQLVPHGIELRFSIASFGYNKHGFA